MKKYMFLVAVVFVSMVGCGSDCPEPPCNAPEIEYDGKYEIKESNSPDAGMLCVYSNLAGAPFLLVQHLNNGNMKYLEGTTLLDDPYNCTEGLRLEPGRYEVFFLGVNEYCEPTESAKLQLMKRDVKRVRGTYTPS